jgi:hypothetical protein
MTIRTHANRDTAGLAMATAPMAMDARDFMRLNDGMMTTRCCALYLHGMGIQTNTCPEDS